MEKLSLPPPLTCEGVRSHLAGLLSNDLGTEMRSRIQGHLMNCEECSIAFADFIETQLQSGALSRPLVVPSLVVPAILKPPRPAIEPASGQSTETTTPGPVVKLLDRLAATRLRWPFAKRRIDLRAVLEEILGGVGFLQPVTLGNESEQPISRSAALQTTASLMQALESLERFNRSLRESLYISLGASVILFLASAVLPSRLLMGAGWAMALGLAFAAIAKLRRLEHDRALIELSLALLPTLPPEQGIEFIQTLYWNRRQKK